ncbi:MAG TPA: BTAD domain-containing putative transcriptional regulator [Gemmatimonadaceae bacterium]
MIRLELLGGVEVVDPENPRASVVVRQPKCLALLVYLVLAGPGAFRSRDSIFALFWPESDQRRARVALSQVLYRLRKSVGSEAIITRGDGEVATEPGAFWCDAVAFTQALKSGDAEAALELYRGDLLPGYFLDDAPGFERWVDEQRARFRREARNAARWLAEAAADAGLAPVATRWAHRSAALSHDDETSLRELLRLLGRVGDRAGALHAYDEFAHRLSRELDSEPSEETCRLIEEIRARSGSIPDPEEPGASGTRLPVLPVPALVAVSEERPSLPQPDGDALTVGVSSEAAPAPLPPGARGRHGVGRPMRRLVAALVMIASIGSLGVVLSHEIPRGGRRSQPARTRIVVGDFTDLNTPSRPGMLGPAITAAVVGHLAAVTSFDVASESIAGWSPGSTADGARSPGFLVTGSVLRSGARVRVNVALVDAAAGSTLKSAAFERESPDAMELVDALAREVSSMVRVAIGGEIRLRYTEVASIDSRARRLAEEAAAERERAHDLEREGRVSTATRSLLRADSLLGHAEAIAPVWREPMIERARVALELAVLHSAPGSRDPMRVKVFLEAGIGEAERAVANDGDDATALETLGLLSYWSWLQIPLAPDSARRTLARTMTVLRSAVDVDPERASAWDQLSAALYSQADYTGAYLAALRAYQVDAYLDDAEQILNRLFLTAYEMGDDALARSWCNEINHRFEQSWTSADCQLSLLAWGGTGGDPAAARRAMSIADEGGRHTVLTRGARPRLGMLLAAVLARAGLRDSAEYMMLRSRTDAAGDPEILPLEAGALLLLGRSDTAAVLLAQYVREKPLHRAGVACSRRFAALRALDRQRTVFEPCAGYASLPKLQTGVYARAVVPGVRDAVYLAVDHEADARTLRRTGGGAVAVH